MERIHRENHNKKKSRHLTCELMTSACCCCCCWPVELGAVEAVEAVEDEEALTEPWLALPLASLPCEKLGSWKIWPLAVMKLIGCWPWDSRLIGMLMIWEEPPSVDGKRNCCIVECSNVSVCVWVWGECAVGVMWRPRFWNATMESLFFKQC